MVKLNKIYTRTGDDGTTGLTDGSRVLKHSSRPQAYGTVDELNSSLGLVFLCLDNKDAEDTFGEIKVLIRGIQNDLFDLGADLSTPISKVKQNYKPLRITKKQVNRIEKTIDKYNEQLKPLNSFILPGGSEAASLLHLSRTVARRAERDVSLLSCEEEINKNSLVYLNRLSDLLFVLSRVLNENGLNDVLWVPGLNQK
ncbi:cob(I)yrinic acid a,c-diamide adenosyltransferase [Alphaproteobacteria bacterium]|jgi:cob(I)alamin adenosyltransferase|nr:cob(I)yrinic acid a,c-diamide adenosyltransferase [Alphaproteobacteria bacterium]